MPLNSGTVTPKESIQATINLCHTGMLSTNNSGCTPIYQSKCVSPYMSIQTHALTHTHTNRDDADAMKLIRQIMLN